MACRLVQHRSVCLRGRYVVRVWYLRRNVDQLKSLNSTSVDLFCRCVG